MLILTRKINESILMDGGIEIMVVSLDSKSVRIGITAPKEVNIVRKEILSKHPLTKYVPKTPLLGGK
jgi:carbon storage regulator